MALAAGVAATAGRAGAEDDNPGGEVAGFDSRASFEGVVAATAWVVTVEGDVPGFGTVDSVAGWASKAVDVAGEPEDCAARRSCARTSIRRDSSRVRQ